ncbi:MAG: hypothetical protein RLZZ546_1081 [Bacteroidota bacterium]|jgi:hypothetical protein
MTEIRKKIAKKELNIEVERSSSYVCYKNTIPKNGIIIHDRTINSICPFTKRNIVEEIWTYEGNDISPSYITDENFEDYKYYKRKNILKLLNIC